MAGKEIEGAFSEEDITTNAPEEHGVYLIFEEENELLYIGRASDEGSTIKSRLLDHLKGKEGECSKNGEWFRCKTMSGEEAEKAEQTLLEGHKEKNGSYPKCNQSS